MEEQFDNPHSRRGVPTRAEVTRALGTFSPLERLVFAIGLALSAFAVLAILYRINNHFMVSIPADGGTLSEGSVGTPRYVNPLLAVSDADRDLSELVYRGLMKEDANGNLVPDLAASYSISPDDLTYTFTLQKAYFQDGTPITSADVAYTVQSALDTTLKSAERINWQGVNVATPDAQTVTFTLNQPYAPFLASTTLGIIPKHIWGKIPYENWAYSDYNTKNVVGSGWYKVSKIATDSSGVPQYYDLSLYRKDGGTGVPRIDGIALHFYASEDALVAAYQDGSIDALGGIDPANAKKLQEEGAQILTAPLPRVFGLFFNQSQAPIFADASVRKAVALAIDKDAVVSQVLLGYGSVANSPIPESAGLTAATPQAETSGNIAVAKSLLEKDGWTQGDDGIYQKVVSKKETDRLSFELDTNNVPELTQAANLIAANLRAAGIEATTKVYETGSLNQDIIRPRKFQALFFGQVVASQSDLFAFWDSSQRTDPGLNIAGYANAAVDKDLEQGLATLDPAKEHTLYAAFDASIAADVPAVFIYSPAYIYAVRGNLTGITLGHVSTPEDRFATLPSWYLETDKVWKVFAPKTTDSP